jgi:hypothetical protein
MWAHQRDLTLKCVAPETKRRPKLEGATTDTVRCEHIIKCHVCNLQYALSVAVCGLSVRNSIVALTVTLQNLRPATLFRFLNFLFTRPSALRLLSSTLPCRSEIRFSIFCETLWQLPLGLRLCSSLQHLRWSLVGDASHDGPHLQWKCGGACQRSHLLPNPIRLCHTHRSGNTGRLAHGKHSGGRCGKRVHCRSEHRHTLNKTTHINVLSSGRTSSPIANLFRVPLLLPFFSHLLQELSFRQGRALLALLAHTPAWTAQRHAPNARKVRGETQERTSLYLLCTPLLTYFKMCILWCAQARSLLLKAALFAVAV